GAAGVGGAGHGGACFALAAAGPGGQPGLRRDDGGGPEPERGVLRGHRGVPGAAEKHQAAMIALLSYLVFLTAGHTTLEQLGRLASADPGLGLYGSGQAGVLGIQTVDMGVTGGILL